MAVGIVMTALFALSLAGCGGAAPADTGETEPAKTAPASSDTVTAAKDKALQALDERMAAERACVYVYKDFGLTENHYTQKAKMAGENEYLVRNMDENWTEDPYEGSSCIRCEQVTTEGDWGGWLFLNGTLPAGSTTPELNEGDTAGEGMDLTGATELRFRAKGETGDESVEFFCAGFGYDGESGEKTVKYPDSAREQNIGAQQLTTEWKEYTIPLDGVNLSKISCGFGYVMSPTRNDDGTHVFYLDDIRFEGSIECMQDAPVMLRSYDTENIYIKNAAYSYDNALVAMAYLSEGDAAKAGQLLDAFVYGVEHDRDKPGRVRNAYASGDITPFPGWGRSARLPGWYDNQVGEWQEDRYQVGSNVGNTSYVALALLQYDAVTGEQKYQQTAQSLMDWVIENCTPEDGSSGFTGGFDGWAESDPPNIYTFTYKSIEHNIDAYAAFLRLCEVTGEQKYKDAADSALAFVQSMYNEEGGYFYTGTQDDGVTPNADDVVLDAQVWSAMALGDAYAPYEKALEQVAAMKSDEGTYPFCLSNENGGWWSEGTAYTALMYALRGDEETYGMAMEALAKIQTPAGLFPAATVDNLSTGMDLFDGTPWEYNQDPHIAPTAWYIMAVNGFNPYTFQ